MSAQAKCGLLIGQKLINGHNILRWYWDIWKQPSLTDRLNPSGCCKHPPKLYYVYALCQWSEQPERMFVYCLLCFNPHVCSAPENKQTNKTSIIGITIAIECKWQKPTETQVFGLVWSPWQSAHKKLGAAFIDMRALLLLLLLRGWRGHAAPYQLPHIVYCHKGWQDERCGNQIGLKSLIGPNAGSSLIRAQREWRISAAHYLH